LNRQRFLLARHAETAYNAAARMQGNHRHTPLTRAGIAQAERMGSALAAHLGGDAVEIWASPAGRTLQTVSIISEHLGFDFFDVRTDPRLFEIDVGDWTGRRYADIVAERGQILCPDRGLFTVKPPAGEWYPAVAARLRDWLDELDPVGTVLVVSHGITLRVLIGLLAGGDIFEDVELAEATPQGSVMQISNGVRRQILP
jgi:probable phosphoglycerate mutase